MVTKFRVSFLQIELNFWDSNLFKNEQCCQIVMRSLTIWQHWLQQARYGSVANFIVVSSNIYMDLDSEEQHSLTQGVTKYCHPFKGMEFKGFDNGKLLSEIVAHSCRYNRITSFCFERYANQN